MKSGLYKIVNKVNGRIYIGSTKNFVVRKQKHIRELKQNNHGNKYLQNDWNRHVEENFEFKIILFCDESNLLFFEQKFLDYYWDNFNNCYNISKMAGRGIAGLSNKWGKHSEATKQIIREKRKLQIYSEETRKKQSEIAKRLGIIPPVLFGVKNHFFGKFGKNHPSFGKKYNLGKKASLETKAKMTLNNKKSIKVICKEIDTGTERIFNSIREASKYYKINHRIITSFLCGKTKKLPHKTVIFKKLNV